MVLSACLGLVTVMVLTRTKVDTKPLLLGEQKEEAAPIHLSGRARTG